MKNVALILLISISTISTYGQNAHIDSLKIAVTNAKDSSRVNLLLEISSAYAGSSFSETINYAQEAKDLAESIKYPKGVAYAYKNIGLAYYIQGEYLKVLNFWQKSLKIFHAIGDKTGESNLNSNIGAVYHNYGDYAQALEYYLKALKVAEQNQDMERIAIVLNNIGVVSEDQKKYKDALDYYSRAYSISTSINYKPMIGTSLVNIGGSYLALGKADSALSYFKRSISHLEEAGNIDKVAHAYTSMGKGYTSKGDYAEAIKLQTTALETAESVNARLEMVEALNGLGETYFKQGKQNQALSAYSKARDISLELGAEGELKLAYQGLAQAYAKLSDFTNAYHYQTLLTAVKDSLYNTETVIKMGNLQALYENEKQQAEIDLLTKDKSLQFLELQRQNMIRNFLIAGLALIVILAFILFRNMKIKQKANKLLARQNEEINLQKEEIESQRDNLEKTFNHLKSTQAQLVQAEKMASLGELTAGIAHEIQNPLNFVNNFSELNAELIAEMKEEIDNGNFDEAKAIAQDIADNQQKIKNHGKRADAIVKGMLLHSRNSSGLKEETDINLLIEEYLKIAYQGLNAKDQSFKVTIQKDFDPTIGHINIIQQDISRVIVNLLTNAFYTVTTKAKGNIENYDPKVILSTRVDNDQVLITVTDNGHGIPESILPKIYQPFFTTKPTGEGTGLGLSLAYDIIKAHEGNITVKSKEGEGTTFTILLPYNNKKGKLLHMKSIQNEI